MGCRWDGVGCKGYRKAMCETWRDTGVCERCRWGKLRVAACLSGVQLGTCSRPVVSMQATSLSSVWSLAAWCGWGKGGEMGVLAYTR